LNALREWLLMSVKEYQDGQMMSAAESIHRSAAMREVLSMMDKLSADKT
jgi:hypothetical protein